MAIFRAMVITTFIYFLHVAHVRGITMNAKDKLALMAVRAAIENKEDFPEIECYSEDFGYFLCDSTGRVIQIDLSQYEDYTYALTGRIAPEIGNLTKLTTLDLHGNRLSGSIPASIGNLKSLGYFDISYNQLSGSIPSSIGNLISLKELWLYGNQLSGSIPSSIGNLKFLQYLALYDNQLSGIIPSSIGNLKSLTQLELSFNQLGGSIPLSIGNLTFLQTLGLSDNQLSGRIPSSIVNLKFLEYFYTSTNYFTGPIVRVNGYPSCDDLKTNCLFGSSLPKGCAPNSQRSKSSCLAFCNATQVGGPCGGNGICSYSTDGKTRACACNQGYAIKASKFTCELIHSPPPRRSPPPLLRSPPRRPPPSHPKRSLRSVISPSPHRHPSSSSPKQP